MMMMRQNLHEEALILPDKQANALCSLEDQDTTRCKT